MIPSSVLSGFGWTFCSGNKQYCRGGDCGDHGRRGRSARLLAGALRPYDVVMMKRGSEPLDIDRFCKPAPLLLISPTEFDYENGFRILTREAARVIQFTLMTPDSLNLRNRVLGVILLLAVCLTVAAAVGHLHSGSSHQTCFICHISHVGWTVSAILVKLPEPGITAAYEPAAPMAIALAPDSQDYPPRAPPVTSPSAA